MVHSILRSEIQYKESSTAVSEMLATALKSKEHEVML
jgi:hypothetical protein